MIIHVCDRCGLEQKQEKGKSCKTPVGWLSLKPMQYRTEPMYELCPACIKVLKLPADILERTKTIGERIIEVLEEIATDAMNDCDKCRPQ